MSNSESSQGGGLWAYRSFNNNPDLSVSIDKVELAIANLHIEPDGRDIYGKIYGDGWSLDLNGTVKEGDPVTLQFTGTGVVDDHPWKYDYLCYVVPHIPEGKGQVPALVGAVTRAISHPNGDGGTSEAGVVYSFYAVLQQQ